MVNTNNPFAIYLPNDSPNIENRPPRRGVKRPLSHPKNFDPLAKVDKPEPPPCDQPRGVETSDTALDTAPSAPYNGIGTRLHRKSNRPLPHIVLATTTTPPPPTHPLRVKKKKKHPPPPQLSSAIFTSFSLSLEQTGRSQRPSADRIRAHSGRSGWWLKS